MVQPEVNDALFIASDNRENFKNVIAKRSDLVKFKSGRLAPSLAGTYQYAGLVLGLASSGDDSGYYKAYDKDNSDGSQTPVGVLKDDANVQAAGSGPGAGSLVSIIYEGDLFKDLLIGLDSDAITAMNGKQYPENGNNIISIRA